MGSQRYILWHDVIYGNTSYRIDFNHCISSNCFMASSLSVWTVGFNSLLLKRESRKIKYWTC